MVGPFSNLFLAGGFLVLALTTRDVSQHLEAIFWIAAAENAFIFVLNMLPCLPLDGGACLRAAIWQASRSFKLATLLGGAPWFGTWHIGGGYRCCARIHGN